MAMDLGAIYRAIVLTPLPGKFSRVLTESSLPFRLGTPGRLVNEMRAELREWASLEKNTPALSSPVPRFSCGGLWRPPFLRISDTFDPNSTAPGITQEHWTISGAWRMTAGSFSPCPFGSGGREAATAD